ncbi:MAG: hypothetical protein M3Y49_15015 [Actinomycetota bacterium]|nr:hypothetical protein [Actinomycetota bacterium]
MARGRGRPTILRLQSHFCELRAASCELRGIVIGVLDDGTTTLPYPGYDES